MGITSMRLFLIENLSYSLHVLYKVRIADLVEQRHVDFVREQKVI
jgi:hypothetical protein